MQPTGFWCINIVHYCSLHKGHSFGHDFVPVPSFLVFLLVINKREKRVHRNTTQTILSYTISENLYVECWQKPRKSTNIYGSRFRAFSGWFSLSSSCSLCAMLNGPVIVCHALLRAIFTIANMTN